MRASKASRRARASRRTAPAAAPASRAAWRRAGGRGSSSGWLELSAAKFAAATGRASSSACRSGGTWMLRGRVVGGVPAPVGLRALDLGEARRAASRPLSISFATSPTLRLDHFERARRGVYFCRKYVSSKGLRWPSIQPKHSATSSVSVTATRRHAGALLGDLDPEAVGRRRGAPRATPGTRPWMRRCVRPRPSTVQWRADEQAPDHGPDGRSGAPGRRARCVVRAVPDADRDRRAGRRHGGRPAGRRVQGGQSGLHRLQPRRRDRRLRPHARGAAGDARRRSRPTSTATSRTSARRSRPASSATTRAAATTRRPRPRATATATATASPDATATASPDDGSLPPATDDGGTPPDDGSLPPATDDGSTPARGRRAAAGHRGPHPRRCRRRPSRPPSPPPRPRRSRPRSSSRARAPTGCWCRASWSGSRCSARSRSRSRPPPVARRGTRHAFSEAGLPRQGHVGGLLGLAQVRPLSVTPLVSATSWPSVC